MNRLQGKIAIVTGAAQGIGRGIANEFAAEGARLALWDLNTEGLTRAADALKAAGADVTAYVLDVADSSAVDRVFAQVEAELGPVEVLVNNAAITRTAMLLKMTDEQWSDVIRVNLTSLFYTTRAAARAMKERGRGSIVNISSAAGQKGTIGQVNYGAAKAGVLGLTKSAALEMARYKVRVNCVCPGVVETEMTTKVLNDEKFRQTYLAGIPLGRVGQPMDIAKAVAFLASDDADFMTGQIVGVNGGGYM